MQNSAERQARLDVAAAHRLAVMHELNEGVWNHISLTSPDEPDNILIGKIPVDVFLYMGSDIHHG